MSEKYYADFGYALSQVKDKKQVKRMAWGSKAKIYMITILDPFGRPKNIINHVKEDGTNNGTIALNSDDLLATDWFVIE